MAFDEFRLIILDDYVCMAELSVHVHALNRTPAPLYPIRMSTSHIARITHIFASFAINYSLIK